MTTNNSWNNNVAAANVSFTGGTMGIGTDATTNAINIGTGANARVTTIGNVSGATAVNINTGTAGSAITTTNGQFELQTGTGDINIGTDGVAKYVTIGNSVGTTELDVYAGTTGRFQVFTNDGTASIDVGPSTLNVGTDAYARTITIGNAIGATAVNLNVGSGKLNLNTPLLVANGGTGAATFTADGVLYGNTTSAIGATAVGTANYVLTSNGAGNAPTFQQTSLTAGVTGVLPIANGGTNASSMTTTDGVVYYDGTRLVTTTAGTSTQVLTSNGAGVAPTFQQVSLTAGVTGVLPIANGGTDASSFSTSNGAVKFDGTRLVSSSTATYNSSNVFNNTAQPAFAAYLSTSTGNVTGDGTVVTVVCDTKLYDQATNYNTSTGAFTAPVAGIYLFTARALIIATGTTTYDAEARIVTTGTYAATYRYRYDAAPVASDNICPTITQIVKMAALDTAYFTVYSYGDVTKKDYIFGGALASGVFTTFSGYLVC